MTQFPDDDNAKLVAFLKQNRPPVPPSTSDLTERIMAQIEAPRPVAVLERLEQVQPLPRKQGIQRRSLWIVSSALAASTLIAFVSYRTMTSKPTPAEINLLEAFLENNWNDAIADDAETNYFQPSQPVNNNQS